MWIKQSIYIRLILSLQVQEFQITQYGTGTVMMLALWRVSASAFGGCISSHMKRMLDSAWQFLLFSKLQVSCCLIWVRPRVSKKRNTGQTLVSVFHKYHLQNNIDCTGQIQQWRIFLSHGQQLWIVDKRHSCHGVCWLTSGSIECQNLAAIPIWFAAHKQHIFVCKHVAQSPLIQNYIEI